MLFHNKKKFTEKKIKKGVNIIGKGKFTLFPQPTYYEVFDRSTVHS